MVKPLNEETDAKETYDGQENKQESQIDKPWSSASSGYLAYSGRTNKINVLRLNDAREAKYEPGLLKNQTKLAAVGHSIIDRHEDGKVCYSMAFQGANRLSFGPSNGLEKPSQ